MFLVMERVEKGDGGGEERSGEGEREREGGVAGMNCNAQTQWKLYTKGIILQKTISLFMCPFFVKSQPLWCVEIVRWMFWMLRSCRLQPH